jgi:hypothetical protein
VLVIVVAGASLPLFLIVFSFFFTAGCFYVNWRLFLPIVVFAVSVNEIEQVPCQYFNSFYFNWLKKCQSP